MAKKPKRGSPAIDMTAMVDVAFLLLTFFILTTTNFREDANLEVDLPSSTSIKELPADEGNMIIYVSDTGSVYVGFTDIDTRGKVLGQIIESENLQGELSEAGYNYFTSVENIGVPLKELIYYLNLEDEEKKVYNQNGVPYQKVDSLGLRNELKAWITQGRIADPRMRFAIRGDGSAPFESAEAILNTLRELKILRMSLITNMEEPPTEGVGM